MMGIEVFCKRIKLLHMRADPKRGPLFRTPGPQGKFRDMTLKFGTYQRELNQLGYPPFQHQKHGEVVGNGLHDLRRATLRPQAYALKADWGLGVRLACVS